MRKILVLTAVLLSFGPAAAGDLDRAMTALRPDAIVWRDASGMPGLQYAIVSGNPQQAGPYTVRVKFSPGSMSRPHWHPERRFITVLQGTWWAGAGEIFDPAGTVPLPAGSFITHHPFEVHFDGAKDEEVIVQISGIGPSATNFVEPR